MKEFTENFPYADFSEESNIAKIKAGLEQLKEYLGKDYPYVLLGEEVLSNTGTFYSIDPNDPFVEETGKGTKIATFQRYDSKTMDVDKLVKGAKKASKEWEMLGQDKRSEVVSLAADIMEERIWLVSAALVREVGKSYIEAYAGVAEAIDFCRFYAIEAKKFSEEKLFPSFGDTGEKRYVPHGVILTEHPFNFEVAIGAGTVACALVMGNSVIMSPSEKSSLCGKLVFDIFNDALKKAGVENKGILNFAPGGGDIADPILNHKDLAGLSFTGNWKVLEMIKEKYGSMKRSSGATLKYCAAEVSGVDPIYVDGDADLDLVIPGVTASALGLSGQKCSALSTLILHKDVYDTVIDRLKESIDNVKFGPVADGNYLGAIISKDAVKAVEEGIKEMEDKVGAKVIYTKKIDENLPGYNVAPTIIEIDSEKMKDEELLHYVRSTEIFAPVFTVVKVNDREEAERFFNAGDFALTGAVFTSDKEFAEHVKSYFNVGNLYINRKCTGALVSSQPFGPLLSKSGEGISQGSRDALLMYVSLKTIIMFG